MADNYVVDPEDIVTLQDENGENVEYEFLDLVEYQEKEYVVLLPMEEEADEVVRIDWVVVTQANPTTEYSYTDPQITKYLTITRIDDRNIRIKA